MHQYQLVTRAPFLLLEVGGQGRCKVNPTNIKEQNEMNATSAFAYSWLLFASPLDAAAVEVKPLPAPTIMIIGLPAICPSNDPVIEMACRISIDPILPDRVTVLPTPRPDNRLVDNQ